MNALVQYAAFLLTVTVLAKPVGHYMACVFEGDRTPCQGRSRLHRDSVRLCSANANNGQNFAGLNANSLFYNLTTAITMMVGRFGLAIPALGLAGMFAAQQPAPDSSGTLSTVPCRSRCC